MQGLRFAYKSTLSISFVFILLGAFSSRAFATEVRDPSGVLAEVRQFLGKITWDEGYRVGDAIQSNTLKTEVLTVSSTEAKIRQTQDGTTVESVVLRSDFDAHDGSFLHAFLDHHRNQPPIHQRDSILIQSKGETDFLLENGEAVRAFEVEVIFFYFIEETDQFYEFKIELTLGKDVPAVAQLLRFAPDGYPEDRVKTINIGATP